MTGRARGSWWLASLEATMTAICIFFFYCCCMSNSLFMGILYKRYFGCLMLLKSCGGDSGMRASRSSCRVVYANIRACIRSCLICLLLPAVELYFCSESLVSSRRHISEPIVPDFGRPMQLLRDEADRFRGLAAYVHNGFSAYRQRSYRCGCCDVIVAKTCKSSHNFYVFSVYQNPDLSNNIFGCLLTVISKVQSVDRKAFFLFTGYVNSHHEEWLGSSTTNLLRRAARDFTSSLGFEQMVTEPTHINGGVLDLVLTDVPDVIGVQFGSQVGASDYSALFIDVVLEQTISYLVYRQEVYHKNSVNSELVRENVTGLNWREIIRSLCPVSSLNKILLSSSLRDDADKANLGGGWRLS